MGFGASHSFGHPVGVLEPVPHGYHGTTFCGGSHSGQKQRLPTEVQGTHRPEDAQRSGALVPVSRWGDMRQGFAGEAL